MSQPNLMHKFELSVEQLDYKFIESCKNVKTLEKILKVLRSGEEGVYPDLTHFCENKLKELAPNNRLLNPAKRILTYSDLEERDRNEIQDDFVEWIEQSRCEEKSRQLSKEHIHDKMYNNIPPVRGKLIKLDESVKETKSDENVKKTSKPRSYSDWDKFDVEKELKSINSNKTSIKKEIFKKELPESIPISGLTEKERQYIANLEKNKGNEAFKAKDYEEAILYYTRSLSAVETVTAYNNRAQACIHTKNYFSAMQDCSKVIEMEPENIKAIYRRGIAYKEVSIYDLAKLDFKRILQLDPKNKLAKEQLKEIQDKQKKIKSICKAKAPLIEEVETSNDKQTGKHTQDNDNKGNTRMTIEEVDSLEESEELRNLDISSDDDDEDEGSSKLPEKVKDMLNVTKQHKKQTGTFMSTRKIEYDNLSHNTEKQIVEIDEFGGNSSKKTNSSQLLNISNKFVNIKIAEETPNASHKNDLKDTNAKSEEVITNVFENRNEKDNNVIETNTSTKMNSSDVQSLIKEETNNYLKYVDQESLNGNLQNSSKNANDLKTFLEDVTMSDTSCEEKDQKIIEGNETANFAKNIKHTKLISEDVTMYSISSKDDNKDMIEGDKIIHSEKNAKDSKLCMEDTTMKNSSNKDNNLEKISPYEFHRIWLSKNATNDSKIGAKCLLQINPEELPCLITNKLDSSFLYGLLKAITMIYKIGKSIEGEKYLKFLNDVPRIQIVSMLLSDTEIKEIKHLYETLENDYNTMPYVSKILNM